MRRRRSATPATLVRAASIPTWNKMLDTEELDGVFTIGPAPQQYQLAPVVLSRGLPVYTEKAVRKYLGRSQESWRN